MATSRVLVTGAGGFVGTRLVERLAEGGHHVRGALKQKPECIIAGEAVVVGDIAAYADWKTLVDGMDTVIHLAGRAHVVRETSPDPLAAFRQINVVATECLARAAAACGVQRLVFLSSVGIHGACSQTAFVENDPPNPWNAYTTSKWEAELALRRIAQETGLDVVIVRPPLIYGPLVKGNFWRLLKHIDSGIPLPFANVDNRRSFVGLENIVELITRCVHDPRATGQTFLVADGTDLSTPDLIRRLASALGRRPRLFPVPVGIVEWTARALGRAALAARLYGSLQIDASKARSVLEWRPVVSLEDGLEEMAKWFRTQQPA